MSLLNYPLNFIRKKSKYRLLFDLGTIAAGFSIGFAEGKGENTSTALEYLCKFGPTALALGFTPYIMKIIYKIRATSATAFKNELERKLDNIEQEMFISEEGTNIRYTDLADDKKDIIQQNIMDQIDFFIQETKEPNYGKEVIRLGRTTAFETLISYYAGNLLSKVI